MSLSSQISRSGVPKFVLVAVVYYFVLLGGSSPARSQDFRQEVAIEGKVSSADGAPLPGSLVELRKDVKTTVTTATADATGHYALKGEKGARYQLRASKDTYDTRVVEVGPLRDRTTRVDFFLERGNSRGAPPFQFSDTPNFAVAGVTDWSNVGLHGSDVNVRTSEALTKEAAALKSATNSSPGSNTEADAHRLLGDESERGGDFVAAVREYETAVKLDATEENYFAWGMELLLHRAGVAAVNVLGKGATAHPNSQRLIEGLGAAFYSIGRFDSAAQQMCRAADLGPSNAEPYKFLGQIEQASNEVFPCSEERLRRFASEQSGDARANFYYGLVLLKKAQQSQHRDDFWRAESFLRKSLTIDPASEVYVQLGMMYNAQGETEKALAEFEKAVSANKNSSTAHYQLSLAYRRSGMVRKASDEMEKYEALHRAEEAVAEKERKEMKQFVMILRQSSPKQ